MSAEFYEFLFSKSNNFSFGKTTFFLILTSIISNLLPSLYIYIKSRIDNQENKLHYKLIMANIALCLLATFIFVFGNVFKNKFSQALVILICIYLTLQQLVLLVKVHRLNIQFNQSIENKYSFKEGINIHWIVQLCYMFMSLLVGIILTETILYNPYFTTSSFISLYSFLFGIITLKQVSKQVFSPNISTVALYNDDVTTSTINDHESKRFQKIYNELTHVLEEKKLYLNHNLCLDDLVKELQTNSKYLSSAIKTNGSTFYKLINEYRVKESKEILCDTNKNHFSMDAISNESGFKTKATFYKYFKESEGLTPLKFKEINQLKNR